MCAALAGGCAAPAELTPDTYVVQPEDTLYSIAWRHDIDFKDLAAWNNLGPAMHIEPGQILFLTPAHAPQTLRAMPVPPAQPQRPPARAPQPAAHAQDPGVGKPTPLPDAGMQNPAPSTGWVWPTRSGGNPAAVAGGGILIPGALGQDVMAAAPGKVVYVGSGLRGYGNLVIIKHSDVLLSAYAHNRDVAVKEGQVVKSGERIGAMGLGPRRAPALYFEIRVNGKPVDVLPYFRRSNF